jgi:protein O-mannosyl-transferase
VTRTITNPGFLSEFMRRHEQMTDRPFCWVLGSGASVQSGIPAGGALALQWLAEIHEMENTEQLPIKEWATAERLGIAGFDYERAANFYPWIYQRRFRDFKEQGYAFLEKVMDKAEPSFGYSVLAQIMAGKRHNVAVTTNFDNLLADALSIYTRTFPLVCGHESLTGYIRPNLRRPLIAKIHRDLLLAPLSNPEEISKLPGEWGAALTKIFDRFTPIVIGYGGNDGSLMNFLKALPPIHGGIFWCHRYRSEIDPAVHEVVQHHPGGGLVPIAGFDELMLQLLEKLKLPPVLPQLEQVHEKRKADYQKQIEELAASLQKVAKSAAAEEVLRPVRAAADAAVERLTERQSWWSWYLKAINQSDPEKSEAMFRMALQEIPDSLDLMDRFADFLKYNRRNFTEAEFLYRRVLSINPNHPGAATGLAQLLAYVHGDLDGAELLYRHAVSLAPEDSAFLGNLANFLATRRHADEEAERLYRDAFAVGTGLAHHINYVQFLAARGRDGEARSYARSAADLLDSVGVSLKPSFMARLAFLWWLLDRSEGRAGHDALGRLKTLFRENFPRRFVLLDDVLQSKTPQLPAAERALAEKLAAAVVDEEKVADLENEPAWQAVTPVTLDTPWPDSSAS